MEAADLLEYMGITILAVGGLIHYVVNLMQCSTDTYSEHVMYFGYQ